jgi:hypothetical protein
MSKMSQTNLITFIGKFFELNYFNFKYRFGSKNVVRNLLSKLVEASALKV